MLFILVHSTISHKLTKFALTAALVAGGAFAATTTANASVRLDANHVQVEAGDTLSQIAQDNGTTVANLVAANHLQDANTIHVGDKLALFPDGNSTATTTTTTSTNQAVANGATTTATSANNNGGQVTTNNSASAPASNLSGSEQAAKDWIAQHESGGSYSATNGQYIGKYQLSASYLNGDYSPANQERVADQYVAQRYGSWVNAQAAWQAQGWY